MLLKKKNKKKKQQHSAPKQQHSAAESYVCTICTTACPSTDLQTLSKTPLSLSMAGRGLSVLSSSARWPLPFWFFSRPAPKAQVLSYILVTFALSFSHILCALL